MSKSGFHKLRQFKTRQKQTHCIYFDTETREEITKKNKSDWEQKELTLRLGWGIYHNRLEDEEENFYFSTGEQFWNWVIDKNKSQNVLYLFAHNIGFDVRTVNLYEHMIVKHGYEVKENHYYDNGGVYMMCLSKGKKRLYLWDTFNYVQMPLEKIGENLGCPKGEYRPDMTDFELSHYCLNDVVIVKKFIESLFTFLNSFGILELKPTASSTALNIFRTQFYNKDRHPLWIHSWKDAIQLERDSYRGGITDCFKVGNYKEKLYKLDINSMYPSIMIDKEMPIKLLYYKDGKTDKNINLLELLKDSINSYHVIADIEVSLNKHNAYILSKAVINKSTKAVFLKGRFREVLASPELKYVLEHGKIHKIHRIAVYEKSLMFKDYVENLYSKRLEYKQSKNKAGELFCKMLLNSLYGKFGQRQSKMELVTDKAPVNIGSRIDIELDGSETRYIQFGKKIFKYTKTEENSIDSFVAISSIITSHARMELVKLIKVAGRKHLYYADTDSLIVDSVGLQNLKPFIDPNKLGFLKLEGESLESSFIAPKYYFFENKQTLKGVRKKHTVLEETPEYLKVKQEQFESFKSAHKLGHNAFVVVKHIVKVIKKRYDKGLILPNGSVEPFSLKDLRCNDG